MKTLVSWVLGLVFVFGLLGTVSVSHLIFDHTQETMASVTMVLISLVSGYFLARREPIRSFLSSRPVLWFLFLFNFAAGALAFLLVGGAAGLMTGIGLGVVALGAASGLVLRQAS
ncbi:hypothetical protein JOF56_010870 [Kibdelosporangium banguiense]|uniref:Uncharacterized protein n=1 Tax=Kibdelosporangium banguiense TaxID=1365924 RepID=A0ABS4U2R6_9PSEU|nr:hypothetical protein [Kibdelosporangium banguiense]MBP2330485.1 hypothetical protein [Kibdelosporangium banguiense]